MDKKSYKQCQSCGMPLKGKQGDLRGSESNGSQKSEMYCYLCYKDGAFCDPEMTVSQMKSITDKALKEKGWIKPLRWVALMQIPKLARWKTK